MIIKPVNEFVQVDLLKEENEGGIVLPDTHQKSKFGAGEVLAIEDNFSIKVGDTVLFDILLLTNVKILGEDLKFIKFSDIIGYIDTK